MRNFQLCSAWQAIILVGILGQAAPVAFGTPPPPNPKEDHRAEKEDSYYYYGPNNLYQYWHDPNNKDAAAQRLGRDTWIHWTWGNQKILRRASVLAGNMPVPVSIDLFRLLDSRNRGTRFRDLGLINEPNCFPTDKPNRFGLYLDHFKGDPLNYYPVKYYLRHDGKDQHKDKDYTEQYEEKYWLKYPDRKGDVDLRHFGYPSGIVGVRLFNNPLFDEEKWDVKEYFKNPGKVEPPYLVGFSCGFCHVGFDPKNPPKDPENPRWENLAANIGNQYLREGELFLGKGRIVHGDKNPEDRAPNDPYKTRGLAEGDFLYHYGATQQPGTIEASRISYDFINNPNTTNPIYGLAYRPQFTERTTWGRMRKVLHILKDGADSVGPEWALMRVPINIGCEGDYWVEQLFNPFSGRRQRPLRIAEVLAGLSLFERVQVVDALGINFDDISPARLAELKERFRSPYGKEEFGQDWQEAWRRVSSLKKYLASYYWPSSLQQAAQAPQPVDNADVLAAKAKRERGAKLFAENCARCHSSKRPAKDSTAKEQEEQPDFLADEVRHAVYPRVGERKALDPPLGRKKDLDPPLGTNLARALATNAVHGDIWAEFSSQEYKALPPLAPVTLDVPVFPPNAPLPDALKAPIRIKFEPPSGGRGYYRTPSLISMWATAPYLHNNSVGDYYVIKDDGTKAFFPNIGQRIGRKLADGSWIDYRIDVSVEGRLKMFADGVDKLLNPWKRHRWVKRTSADSALIPDLGSSIQQLIASVAHDVIQGQISAVLKERQVPPAEAEKVVQTIDGAVRRVIQDALNDGRVSFRFAWSALQVRARDHADRLFELLFDDLRAELAQRLNFSPVAVDRLRLPLRREFLDRLDRLDERLRQAALLKIPAGTPVNLYANLGPGAVAHVTVAHVRYRGDPRGLAEALLQLSDCPDLVEDSGHEYGWHLGDAEKKDLIEFLKTL
jgi:mono/diheme cytochrome c family protein